MRLFDVEFKYRWRDIFYNFRLRSVIVELGPLGFISGFFMLLALIFMIGNMKKKNTVSKIVSIASAVISALSAFAWFAIGWSDEGFAIMLAVIALIVDVVSVVLCVRKKGSEGTSMKETVAEKLSQAKEASAKTIAQAKEASAKTIAQAKEASAKTIAQAKEVGEKTIAQAKEAAGNEKVQKAKNFLTESFQEGMKAGSDFKTRMKETPEEKEARLAAEKKAAEERNAAELKAAEERIAAEMSTAAAAPAPAPAAAPAASPEAINVLTNLMKEGKLSAEDFAKAVVSLSASGAAAPAKEKTPLEKQYDMIFSKHIINTFKSPSACKWPDLTDSMIAKGKIELVDSTELDCTYIETYIDAPNSYGTMLRKQLRLVLSENGFIVRALEPYEGQGYTLIGMVANAALKGKWTDIVTL